MKNLLQEHYRLICKRGLINPYTTTDAFIAKISEEYTELIEAYQDDTVRNRLPSDDFIQESIDLAMVVFNMLQHFEFDIEGELKRNIQKQKDRVINIDS